MTDDELTARSDKAFAFAQETAKQQITLSTGILALTLTFLKDVAPKGTPRALLEIAWVLYVVSTAAGVATLMALTGNLERPQAGRDSIYSPNIKLFAATQALAFLAAMGLTVAFGIKAI